MAKENRVVTGTGFPGLLAITFIVLKLTGVIDWSWWWILAPLWGAFVVGLLAFLVWAIIIASSKK